MSKRRSAAYLGLGFVFVLNLAGASWLALAGSDPQPWEKSFPGQCAHPTVSVVYEYPKKPKPKVIEVDLTGDFSACVGSQVLVTTYKTGNIYSYSVAEITETTTSIKLLFIKHGGLGDFYQKFPLIVNYRLVPTGPLAPPTTSIGVSDIQVVFAWTWN